MANFDNNKYLDTILDPFTHIQPIPDLDMTASVLKAVTYSRNITVGNSGGGMLLFTPHSRSVQLRLFTQLNDGSYGWLEDIIPDEDISENYTWTRFISGGIKVQSATTSGGNFNVSGTFNAVAYQFLPPLSTLRFDSISSYKRADYDVELQVPIQDGIAAISIPDGNHEFHPVNTNGIITTRDLTKVFLTAAQLNVVNNTDDQITINIWDKQIPENFTRWVDLNHHVSFHMIGTTTTITYEFTYYKSFTNDWINPETITIQKLFTFNADAGSNMSQFVSVSAFIPGFLNEIHVNITDGTWVTSNHDFSIMNYDYYLQGQLGPGIMVAFQGVSPGNQITVSGKLNYEVVPDAQLARQITTSMQSVPENPNDLELAENFVTNATDYGFKFVMKLSDYNFKQSSGTLRKLSKSDHLLNAAGWPDWLKKIVKIGTPIVSGLANTFHPSLGQVVNTLGETFSSTGSYRNMLNSSGAYRNSTMNNNLDPNRTTRNFRSAATWDPLFVDIVSSSTFDANEVVEYGQHYDIVTGISKWTEVPGKGALMQYSNSRGMWNVAFYYSAAAFPVVTDLGAGYLGNIYFAQNPCAKSYRVVKYDLGDAKGHYYLATAYTVSPDVLYQIAAAEVLAGQPQGFWHIEVNTPQTEEYLLDESFVGPSFGLAALVAVRKIVSPYVFSGAVDHYGRVYAVGEVKYKAAHVIETRNLKMVTVYDEEIEGINDILSRYHYQTPEDTKLLLMSIDERAPMLYFVDNLTAALGIAAMSPYYGLDQTVRSIDIDTVMAQSKKGEKETYVSTPSKNLPIKVGSKEWSYESLKDYLSSQEFDEKIKFFTGANPGQNITQNSVLNRLKNSPDRVGGLVNSIESYWESHGGGQDTFYSKALKREVTIDEMKNFDWEAVTKEPIRYGITKEQVKGLNKHLANQSWKDVVGYFGTIYNFLQNRKPIELAKMGGKKATTKAPTKRYKPKGETIKEIAKDSIVLNKAINNPTTENLQEVKEKVEELVGDKELVGDLTDDQALDILSQVLDEKKEAIKSDNPTGFDFFNDPSVQVYEPHLPPLPPKEETVNKPPPIVNNPQVQSNPNINDPLLQIMQMIQGISGQVSTLAQKQEDTEQKFNRMIKPPRSGMGRKQ